MAAHHSSFTRAMNPNFIRFLLRAKANTYAAQGDQAALTPLLPGTRQLEYRDGTYLYRDIYAGMSQFVGQEIVYQADQPIWSMSYAGGLAPDQNRADAGKIYTHLRKALLQADATFPLRGPREWIDGELEYLCTYLGTIARFHGAEEIRCGGTRLYALEFSGGILE